MRNLIALALLMLPAASAVHAEPAQMFAHHVFPTAMKAPLLLEIQSASATTTTQPDGDRVEPVKGRADKWGTRVDYDHSIDRPDMLVDATRNREIARPSFATLKRSFGEGGFQPYVGLGVGQASAKFGAIDPTTDESYAVKGVVGGNMTFTNEVGAYVQYDYAIATENPALADDDKSHGISFGLSISLN